MSKVIYSTPTINAIADAVINIETPFIRTWQIGSQPLMSEYKAGAVKLFEGIYLDVEMVLESEFIYLHEGVEQGVSSSGYFSFLKSAEEIKLCLCEFLDYAEALRITEDVAKALSYHLILDFRVVNGIIEPVGDDSE